MNGYIDPTDKNTVGLPVSMFIIQEKHVKFTQYLYQQ